MRGICFFVIAAILLWMSPANTAAAKKPPTKPVTENILIKKATQILKGDLPSIKKRGYIRVLVSYSKTNFFIEKGTMHGFEYELLKQYEKFLNRGIKKRTRKIKMLFLPVPFQRLLAELKRGRGDIAAAGLTITPRRRKRVDFTTPYITQVNEVLVANKNVRGIKNIFSLAGKKIYVRENSSYIPHLWNLNGRLKSKGKRPVKIVVISRDLGTEDILELVNAGALKLTVADSHIAKIWSKIFPNIKIYSNITIHKNGKIAWAIRKRSPKLFRSINAFFKKHKKGTRLGNIFFKRYYQNTKWVKNPVSKSERKKFLNLERLFAKYGKRYNFTTYMIAAQAYQESGLSQNKRSPAGAIGIMQILPKTARDKNVNIRNIQRVENNIHAGVKYLDFLRKRYFNNKKIDPLNKVFFTWAGYNAGPNRINQLRRLAKKRGLNPNRWFYNVEEIASEKIGRETVEYVSNITKYYLAYKLYFEKVARQNTVRRAIKKRLAK